MNILVLSDLHLSNNDKFSATGWNEDKFIKKLDLIITMYGIDKIILNGDIFELSKYGREEITKANSKLLNYLAFKEAKFILGNHDHSLALGLDHYKITNSSNQIIYIEHGHKADFFGGTKLGRFLNDSLFKTLKKILNLPFIQATYFNILGHEEGLLGQKKYKSYEYLKYAIGLLGKNDVVILGHTHEIEAHHSYKGSKPTLYLNCGTCTFGRFQAIALDTETLRYSLIFIEPDKDELKNHPVYKGNKSPILSVSPNLIV